MNRLEWRQRAERWLEDAKILLDNHRWSAAYYIAGYAVEFGLKACILARLGGSPEVIFESQNSGKDCWTHNPNALLKQAGLKGLLDADMTANPALGNNWLTVRDWIETARYEDSSEVVANELYSAITDTPNGVMQWIRAHW